MIRSCLVLLCIFWAGPLCATAQGGGGTNACDTLIKKDGSVLVGNITYEEPTFFIVFPCGTAARNGEVVYKHSIAEIHWATPVHIDPFETDVKKFVQLIRRSHPVYTGIGLLFALTATLFWGTAPLIGLLILGLLFSIFGFHVARNLYSDDELSPRVRRRARHSMWMAYLSFVCGISVAISFLVGLI